MNGKRRFIQFVIVVGIYLTILNFFSFGASEYIRVGVFEFDPLCRISKQGKASGLFVDIFDNISAKEGWQIKYKAGTLSECFERLEKGDIDLILAASYSKDNEQKYYYTKETVISTWAQVYALDRSSIQSIIQLDKKILGVVRDDPYNPEIRRIIQGFDLRVTFMEFGSSGEVFQAINKKWIDAGVVDRLYGIKNESSADVEQTPIIFSPVELRFVTNKEGRRNLIDTIDYNLTRLKNMPDSIYYRLLDQVLGEKKRSGIPVILFWILGIALTLLILFVSISFLLHRQVENKTKELSGKNWELQREMRERETTEDALMESEEKFRLISEESLMAIAIIQDDEIKYANEAFSRLSEYSLEEIMKWDTNEYTRLIHPNDRDFVIEQSRKKQQGDVDTINHYTYRILTKSRKLKWVEHYSRTIIFKSRYASLMTAAEITETMETRENLATEKERLAVTLRSIGDGVITTNKEGEILLVNRIAEAITGWKQEDIQGLKISSIFRVRDYKTGRIKEDPVQRVISDGTIIEAVNDSILVTRDGSERIISSNCAPIRDKDQQIIGAVLVIHDITEKRQMELEIQKALKLESLGILAAGIAHDFNNLLAIIMGNIGLAKRYIDLKDKAYKILDNAEKGAYSATGLSQQLLTFARGNAPVKETASIRELIEDSTGFALRGSPVRCDCHFSPDLYSVDVDKGQICQVFQNLIINAEQAMPIGGIITIHARNLDNDDLFTKVVPAGKYIEIVFRDQGVGIPPDHLDKIFDPFFTTKQKGNGLGLSVVYSIIKKHEGHIHVESQLGKGTSFYIYLPAIARETIPISPQIEGIQKGAGKILIMDDNEAILEMLGAILEGFGYIPVFAKDGEQAIKKYCDAIRSQQPFSVIITDLTIAGGMGGKEAIEKLKEIDPQIKAIVFSGYANDPVVANYSDYGFKAVINKPFRIPQLSQVIHQVINVHN